MTQPQPELPPAGPEGPAASAGAARIGALRVVDHLEPRIRLPADLLRCVIASIEIVLLAGLGLLARATANGVEYDVGHASRRLPRAAARRHGIRWRTSRSWCCRSRWRSGWRCAASPGGWPRPC